MLSKYVTIGDKIEFKPLVSQTDKSGDEKKRVYYSRVNDIISEDKIEIAMPMEKSKLILLPVEMEIKICYFTNYGLYQCSGKISERYKRNNMYLLLIDITSQLTKEQRREYYRYSCAIDVLSRMVESEEATEKDGKKAYVIDEKKPLQKGVIVDISGGGLRFVSDGEYEQNSEIFCRFSLMIKGELKKYSSVATVLYVKDLENRKGYYEYRVQFLNMDSKACEEIIQYIFEEERKYRKREKG